MKVRLLVNRATEKILYMEAGSDFVDVLLGFLQLPVASILGVFNGDMEVGSISNVYASLRKLSDSSLVVAKDDLLKPSWTLQLSRNNPKLLLPAETVYRCSNSYSHASNVSWASGGYCNHCRGNSMTDAVSITGDMPVARFVQHYLSFIITDELTILPASTIESIVLLNKLKVEKMSDLDSIEAIVSSDQALELLKVSFTSRSALNQVFNTALVNMPPTRT